MPQEPKKLSEDAAMLRQTLPLMHRIASELRDIKEATASDKDFVRRIIRGDNPNEVFIDEGPGDDPAVMQSKRINARMHRAASAMLDVYDRLGIMDFTVLTLTLASDQKDIHQDTTDVIAKHYPRLGKKPLLSEPLPPHEHLSRRRFFSGLITAFGGIILIDHYMKREAAHKQRTALEEDAIALEARMPNLTERQKEVLLTLQKLSIPELKGQEGYGVMDGIGALMVIGGLYRFNDTPNTPPVIELEPTSGPTPREHALEKALISMDEALNQACANARITLPDDLGRSPT